MRLSPIKKGHIEDAAQAILYDSVPTNYLFNNYWVLVNGVEFPFKQLVRIAYQLAIGKEEWLEFQSTEGYREYVRSLGFPIIYHKEALSCFAPYELELFSSIAGARYSKDNEDHKRFGEHLRVLVRKVNLWAELACFGDYRHQPDLRWQLSGNFNKNQWTVIQEVGSIAQISFFIGCNCKGDLFMHLGYRKVSLSHIEKVSKSDGARLDAYLQSAGYRELLVPYEQVKGYNWDGLIAITRSHLEQHTGLYRELQALLQTPDAPDFLLPTVSTLTEGELPESIRSYAKRERTFEGRDVNWESKAAVSAKLGFDGEQLVISAERKRLEAAGLNELAAKVGKQGDGEGYDVLSFDEAGNEVHIEVKTTPKTEDEPFYMSAHERAYVDACEETYCLYRVYDFNPATGSGRFFKLTADELKALEFTATGFEVSKS